MSKKIIAVDIDDVIADSTDALRLLVNTKLGINLEEHHYRVPGEYWGYYEQVWEQHNVHHKISYEELERGMSTDQSHVVLKQGAADVLAKLSQDFEIVLVTSRDKETALATARWIEENLGVIHKGLHVLGNHKTKAKPLSKGEVCREIGASWLIDDNPEHCLSAIDHGVKAILFGNYGWHHSAPKHLTLCRDWQSVEEYFSAEIE